jgi:hypothetical protein
MWVCVYGINIDIHRSVFNGCQRVPREGFYIYIYIMYMHMSSYLSLILSYKQDGLSKRLNDVMVRPEMYVLKPQREGGGNNLYGADAAKALCNHTAEELKAYILMERIQAPIYKTLILSDSAIPRLVNTTTGISISCAAVFCRLKS